MATVQVDPLLDLAMVHLAKVRAAVVLEHQGETLFDNHDMICKIFPQLCQCQATILLFSDVVWFQQYLYVLHVPVKLLVLVVFSEEQCAFHVILKTLQHTAH